MAITDTKVIFNLQNEILEAPELSDARKVEMLKNSIKNTIGNITDIDEKKIVFKLSLKTVPLGTVFSQKFRTQTQSKTH